MTKKFHLDTSGLYRIITKQGDKLVAFYEQPNPSQDRRDRVIRFSGVDTYGKLDPLGEDDKVDWVTKYYNPSDPENPYEVDEDSIESLFLVLEGPVPTEDDE